MKEVLCWLPCGAVSTLSLATLVDGLGASSTSLSSTSSSCGGFCNQLESQDGCGRSPVTESVTRLKMDYKRRQLE